MLSCGIETRLQILSPHKKSIGWAVGAEVTSRRYYGKRKPIFKRGQDGRVVKAGALGGAHVKSWDRTWSSSDSHKALGVGLVLKLRPLVTVAGVSQILGLRMAEWLKPGLWEILTIKLRGIEPGQILTLKKPTGEGWY